MYHATVCIQLYVYRLYLPSTWLVLGSVVHGVLAFVGICIQMFKGDGRISKRTGADKRTSGFPFKNATADLKKRR